MSKIHSTRGVRNCDTVQDELKQAKAIQGASWRKVALLDDYSGIPAGTLCSIAKTGVVPKKWRERLGLPALVPAPVCPVHGVVHTGRCPRPRKILRWRDLPVETLRKLFEDRQEMGK